MDEKNFLIILDRVESQDVFQMKNGNGKDTQNYRVTDCDEKWFTIYDPDHGLVEFSIDESGDVIAKTNKGCLDGHELLESPFKLVRPTGGA